MHTQNDKPLNSEILSAHFFLHAQDSQVWIFWPCIVELCSTHVQVHRTVYILYILNCFHLTSVALSRACSPQLWPWTWNIDLVLDMASSTQSIYYSCVLSLSLTWSISDCFAQLNINTGTGMKRQWCIQYSFAAHVVLCSIRLEPNTICLQYYGVWNRNSQDILHCCRKLCT